MKYLDQIGLKFYPIAVNDGIGYALYYSNGIKSNVCIVISNDEGDLNYASYEAYEALDTHDFVTLITDSKTDNRVDASWAFSMIGAGSVDEIANKLDLPVVNRDVILNELEILIDQEYGRVENLDQNSLQALSKSYNQTKSAYDFYKGDTERSVIRRQAAASYPILADNISSNLSAKMAVDQKKPVSEIVAKLLSIQTNCVLSKPALKRLAAADKIPANVKLASVVKMMSLVPPDWIPTTGEEWKSFCHVSAGLFETLKASDESIPLLVKSSQGKWTDFCHRVIKKAGVEPTEIYEDFKTVMWNAYDMVHDFRDFIVIPLAAFGGDSDDVTITTEMGKLSFDSAFTMLINGKSLTDVADHQRRFHLSRNVILSTTSAVQQEMNQKLKASVEVNTWPGLTEPVQAPNGLWLVPLRSTVELKEEGAQMGHCVGGYTGVAEKCQSFIVSVRSLDDDGKILKRHSTIEYNDFNQKDDNLQIKQHQAHGNSTPSAIAKDAEKWYTTSMASGNVKINRKLINAFLDNVIIPDDAVERLCTYDWKDKEIINIAVQPWFPYVGKKYQSMGFNDILDSEEISSVSKTITPDLLYKM